MNRASVLEWKTATAQTRNTNLPRQSAETKQFWKTQLEGAPALLEIPTDFPRPATQSQRTAKLERVFPQEFGRESSKFCPTP